MMQIIFIYLLQNKYDVFLHFLIKIYVFLIRMSEIITLYFTINEWMNEWWWLTDDWMKLMNKYIVYF